MISNCGDTAETVSRISVEEIGKVGLPVQRASLHFFSRKGVHWIAHLKEVYISIQSDLKDSKF